MNSVILRYFSNMKNHKLAYFRIVLKDTWNIDITGLFSRAMLFIITSCSQHEDLLSVI